MRIFAAIDLAERARSELAALITTFRRHGANVQWVETSRLHLTLRFFGEIDEPARAEIQNQLRKAAEQTRKFQMRLAGLSGFPNLKRPTVLWVGVDEGKAMLESLAATINSACPGGDKEAQRFHPHVTLGRVDNAERLDALIGEMKWMTFSSAHRFDVDHLSLYRSVLGGKQPVYEAVAKFAFTGAS